MFAVATAVKDGQGQKNLYEVLRVKQNASAREIKSAYRSLVKVYHPDTCRSEEVESSEFIASHFSSRLSMCSSKVKPMKMKLARMLIVEGLLR